MRKLAVIMSLYRNDALEFVKLAVDSVLNQTFSDFDFYIQFDGPVHPEVDSFISTLRDSRIKVYRRAENKGLAQSLNDLLSIVMPLNYEYIARMDADDINKLNRFEKQLDYFSKHPQLECLGTWAIEITSTGSEYFRKKMPVSHEDCYNLFRKRDCMIHPTVMFKKSYIEKAGFYSLDTYFGEDTMMWCQGFSSGCVFGNVPEYLFNFRLDNNFFERRRGWKHAMAIFKLRHKVNKILKYGLIADFWALAYAVAKLMPTPILNMIYKTARNS